LIRFNVDVPVLQAALMATSNTQLLLLLLLLPAQARPATLFGTSYKCTVWQPRMCKVIFIAVCTMLYNVQLQLALSLLVSELHCMYSAEGQPTRSPQGHSVVAIDAADDYDHGYGGNYNNEYGRGYYGDSDGNFHHSGSSAAAAASSSG